MSRYFRDWWSPDNQPSDCNIWRGHPIPTRQLLSILL